MIICINCEVHNQETINCGCYSL